MNKDIWVHRFLDGEENVPNIASPTHYVARRVWNEALETAARAVYDCEEIATIIRGLKK